MALSKAGNERCLQKKPFTNTEPAGDVFTYDLQQGELKKNRLIYDVVTYVLATLCITCCNYGSFLLPV